MPQDSQGTGQCGGQVVEVPGVRGAGDLPSSRSYEAELLESASGGPDPFADLDTDKPYAVAAQPVEAEAPADGTRRPCPMCGEMIVATAAKCRYCGEIFDPTLKKVKKGGKKGKLKAVASAQRNLLICILLNIVSYITLVVLGRQGQGSPARALAIVILCAAAVLLAAAIGGLIYTFILATKIYNTGLGIILSILTLIPCLGLIVLLMVNQKATAMLQENGYEVGLFGAKSS